MREVCPVKSLHFEDQNKKVPVRDLCGNQEFHVQFWWYINCLALKLKFITIASFKNIILI